MDMRTTNDGAPSSEALVRRERDRQLALLTDELSACPTLDAALATALATAIAVHGADFGNIRLHRAGELTIVAQHGFDRAFLDAFRRVLADDDSACGRALRDGRPVEIHDVERDPRFAGLRAAAAAAGFRAVQSLPLITASGLFVGMLSVHFARPHVPSRSDTALLAAYATQVANAVQRFTIDNLLARH
jgi:GAF domain-containing protein